MALPVIFEYRLELGMWLHCKPLVFKPTSSLSPSRFMYQATMYNNESDHQKATTSQEHIVTMSVACIILVKMTQP
jgi:hypothetical protein